MNNRKEPEIFKFGKDPSNCDLLLLAAGFEERAFHFLSEAEFPKSAHCIVIKFINEIPGNDSVFLNYINEIKKKFDIKNIHIISLSRKNLQVFESNLYEILSELPRETRNIWIDISGMPTYCVCISLNIVRAIYPSTKQNIIYTSAKTYFPTHEEFNRANKIVESFELLPNSMAMEMSEVLILESFSGHRSKEGISCLAIFAGYDAYRSAGVIESINPSMLLLLHGDPGDIRLKWRLELSKKLHNRFVNTRKTASEIISTLNPFESLDKLEEYYEFLFEDYDFTIAPICSKMQIVGTYLFWERYKEVQLVFPLPIGYSIDRKPIGIGNTFITELEARNSLYRSIT